VSDAPPAGLDVQTDLDGFRCTIRPHNPSENWLLLWVPLWWLAGAGFLALVMELDPSLGDVEMMDMPAWAWLAWPAGLFGWAPSFMLWRARRRQKTAKLNLDPGRLTANGRSWAVGDIVSVDQKSWGLLLKLRRGRGRVRLRSNSHTEIRWLAEQIRAARVSEQPELPAALAAMREDND